MSGKLDDILTGTFEEKADFVTVERHGAVVELHGLPQEARRVYDDNEGDKAAVSEAIVEQMVMFGARVVKMPESDKWLRELQFYASRQTSALDLSQYDLEDDVQLEYVFKRHYWLTPRDIAKIGLLTGWQDDEFMTLENIASAL